MRVRVRDRMDDLGARRARLLVMRWGQRKGENEGEGENEGCELGLGFGFGFGLGVRVMGQG